MSDAIKDAQTLYTEALAASRQQRQQMQEDLDFSNPSDPQQWDDRIRSMRERDPGGARPCLVFDQTGQYVQNVAGSIQRQPPSLHALPVDGTADKRTAEKLDGFFRHIEYTSRAQQHYARALLSSARAGVGYLIVRPEFTDRALGWQEPRISSEGDPLRVVFDPWSSELDGSDAGFGFLLTPLSHREFDRRWPGKDKCSFGDADRKTVDERESILVVEQWRKIEASRNMIVCVGQDGDETSLAEEDYHAACQRAGVQLPVIRTYTDKTQAVKWARMSGADMLDAETTYPASGIGIVPVYGYEGYQGGRLTYCGIPRRARNAQRSYNYHMSELHVFMAQSPKAPWLASTRATRGLEALWDKASVESRAWLPYNDLDDAGAINQPSRVQPSINLQNHVAGAEQALKDIQASLGMYQANLGAPSNETSGVAIDSRKEQGEASTANFPANLAAGIGQVGKLCMEMIPRLIDTKRQVRILGIDGSPGMVTIDPGSDKAAQETSQGLVINPNVGRYDVRVVVGASYTTQRTQAQAAFTEMMRAAPNLMPAIAPLWAQTLDVPNADKLAQVLTAVAPPEVRAILSPESENQPTTADLQAKVQELTQALQEAVQHAHDAQQDADQAEAQAAAKDEENEIRRYEAETNRLKVTGANEAQIQAIVQQMVNDMLTGPEPLGDEVGEMPEGGGMPGMGEEAPAMGVEPALPGTGEEFQS